MKVLVLASEPVGPEHLRKALGDEAGDAEVRVVAPALNESGLAFWVSDSDEAIERAGEIQRETVQRMSAGGVPASGDTGESEPLVALQDALAVYDAERIVLFVHPDDETSYREQDIAGEAERRFERPVVLATLGG